MGKFWRGRFLVLIVAVSFLYSSPVYAQGNLWHQLKQTAKDAVRSTLDAAHDVDDVVDSAVDDVTGYSKYPGTYYSQQSSTYAQPTYSPPSNTYTPPAQQNTSATTSTQHAPIYSPYSGNQRASYVLSHPQNAQAPPHAQSSAGQFPSANGAGMYPVTVAPGLPTTDHLNPTY